MPLRLVAKACAAIWERSVLKFDFELQKIDVQPCQRTIPWWLVLIARGRGNSSIQVG